jgi:hypothetical protein
MSHATSLTARTTRATSWSGRGLSTVVVLFLVFDATIHLLEPTPVVDAFAQLGIPLHLSPSIGILALVCTALYAIPRTSALGALLLTAYLGGATAIQVRVEAGWFPVLFPSLLGAFVWGGLALRNARVRALLAFDHSHQG